MNIRTTSTSPVDQDCGAARIFVAIELSRKSWVVALQTPLADKISLHTLAAGDVAALLALVGEARRKAAALGRAVEVVSCYEAGYDGFWLHRVLTARGIDNHVFDPASLQVSRRARRAKTDRIDARAMLRALMAHLRGEPKVVSVVRVPSVDEEDLRRPHRERERLIGERVQHVNRIKGLCALHGIYDYQPLKRDRRRRLGELRTGDGRPLPRRLMAEIARELTRLELVLEMIAEVEAERDAVARGAAHPYGDRIRQLVQLKAVGPEFSSGLMSEVFYRAFDNRRQLAAYVGLDGSPFDSGRRQRDQGISKAGNPRARRLLIELAWMWLRHQPDSALSRWFRDRVGLQKGRVRRIAVVAVARKLLIALWRYLETGQIPEGAVLKA